ncbi:MAG: hypothetical protein H7338_19115 [Candidatus Sericytochromatia bacterium]|nr:hypothetical protein [Candidatus Sericytochromatia bacterium]
MLTSRPIAFLIAGSLSLGMLAGCTSSPTGTNQNQSGSQSARAQTSQEAASVSQTDQSMNDMEMVGEQQSNFSTQAIGIPQATADGMVSATAIGTGLPVTANIEVSATAKAAILSLTAEQKAALKQRTQTLTARAGTRLQALNEAAKKAMVRTSVANDFGGQTVTMTFNFTAPNGNTHKSTMVRAYNGDKVLVASTLTISRSLKNGMTVNMLRTRELQADSSYKVHAETTQTLPNGQSRVTISDKTISATGAISGTGTLKRMSGTSISKTVNITLGGTEEKAATTVTDLEAQTSAKVEPTIETGTATSATVTTAGSSATEVTVGADLDATVTAS